MYGTIFGATTGLQTSNKNFKLVKKVGVQGDKIAKHNHPEALVLFTVTKGEVQVFLNDNEEHILTPGKLLHFDGDNYINATFLADSEVFVTLVNKEL